MKLIRLLAVMIMAVLLFPGITFAAGRVELIVPSTFTPNIPVPVIIRALSAGGDIEREVSAPVTVLVGASPRLSRTVSLHRGVGYVSLALTSTSDVTVGIEGVSGERAVRVSTRSSVDHEGTLTGASVRWDSAFEHRVNGDLLIPRGTVLTVEEGARVLLGDRCNILVEGALQILGTAEAPVLFTAENPALPWGGIEITGGDASFRNCFFQFGGADTSRIFGHSQSQPVIKASYGSVLLTDCWIVDNPGKALGGSEGTLAIDRCVITRCDTGGEFMASRVLCSDTWVFDIPSDDGVFVDDDNDGFYFSGVYPRDGEPSILSRCVFSNGKDDGVDHNGARLRIESCWIEGFANEGVAGSNGEYVHVVETVVRNCGQGIEAGYGNPEVTVDHCVLTGNTVGLRFGDSYDWGCSGSITATNSIFHGNDDNILNYDRKTGAAVADGITVSYSMTNDPDYDSSPACITGTPRFDASFRLLPGSSGFGAGSDGSNMGLAAPGMSSGIVINEILALNGNWNPDEYGQFDDWVELCNTGGSPVDVGGMYITDDPARPDRWRIPDTDPAATTILPGGRKLLWLDGEPQQGPLHADLRLGGDGEFIGLYAVDGITPLDSLTFGPQEENRSFGRAADGGGVWRTFVHPTPGSDNAVTPSPVKEYFITCDPDSFHIIYQNYREDIDISAILTHRGTTWDGVTLRIRGETSRSYPKKSLRMEFKGEPFAGDRDVLIFNAEYGDASYLRQYIAASLFRDIGYPCFTTEYARLYLNGEFLGLYLCIDNIDKSFLRAQGLDPDGTLYKAAQRGACMSVFDDIPYHWDKKTREDTGDAELTSLIHDLNATPDSLYEAFARERLDYDRMVDIVSMNILLSNASTYYHNYYIYQNTLGDGRWTMLPWDLDKTFGTYGYDWPYQQSGWHGYRTPDNPFVERALISPAIFSDIVERMGVLSQTVFTNEHLASLIDSLQTVIEPSVLQDETDSITDMAQWRAALKDNESYLRSRYQRVMSQIDNQPRQFRINRIMHPCIDTVTLTWNAAADPNGDPVTYTVLYSPGQNFPDSSTVIFSGITDTRFTLPECPPPGDYYWHVLATDGVNVTQGFDVRNTFRVVRGSDVPANITGNVLLTSANSPYVVRDKITVSRNAVLSAEPGVVLLFEQDAGITVQGKLLLTGTPDAPVLLRPDEPGTFWAGIGAVSSDASIEFTRVVVENASVMDGDISAAVKADSSAVKMNGVVFRGCAGGVATRRARLEMSKCTFESNEGSQIWAESGGVTVTGCVFRDNTTPQAIVLREVTDARIDSCVISGSVLAERQCAGLTVSGTTITGCPETGIIVSGGSEATVRRCIIEGNGTGVRVSGAAFCSVVHCTFHDNGIGIAGAEPGGGEITVANTILSASRLATYQMDGASQIVFSHSLSDREALPGDGCIMGYPGFADTAHHDFHLVAASPCIDAGDPAFTTGNDSTPPDIGAFEYRQPLVVITEINCMEGPNPDPGDWVELFNPSDASVDLSGWELRDSGTNNVFVLPEGTRMDAHRCLVLCRDRQSFAVRFPGVQNAIGDLGFGLSEEGEMIRLMNEGGETIDSLSYRTEAPWPVIPAGKYGTLALSHWSLDNAAPLSWRFSEGSGTPGTFEEDVDSDTPVVLFLDRNYPNPFNAGTTIPFSLSEPSRVVISVYSIIGQRVGTLTDTYYPAGSHQIFFRGDNLSSGVYFVIVNARGIRKTRSVTLVR